MLTSSPLRVAVLCSHRAPGLMHLLTHATGRRLHWDIVCCLTSENTFEEEAAVAAAGVPIVHHPIRQFRDERHRDARLSDPTLREEYDRRTIALLYEHRPDLVLLAGYLLLLTPPMLAAYRNRILNVHHSDLLLRKADGSPRYAGLRAVRDAILAGESETRSTVHVVTEDLDEGPPILRSTAFDVPEVAAWAMATGADDVLRKVVWAHQEWMLRSAFGPLMEHALDLLSQRESINVMPERYAV